MFGQGNTGFTFGSNQQQQQQQQPQQPQTGFGGFGTLGSTNTVNPAPVNTTTGLGGMGGFGGMTSTGGGGGGLFGSAAPATNTTSTFGSAWGSTQPQQQQNQLGSNAAGTSLFGRPAATTGTTSTAPSGGFGSFGSVGATVPSGPTANQPTTNTSNNGTGNPSYVASSEKEGSSYVTLSFHMISAMPNYSNWSFEELRFADYQLGKKYASSGIGTSAFGGGSSLTSAAPTIGFGSAQPSTTTSLFGAPSTGTTTVGFGSTTTPASTGFGTGFGSSKPAFGAATTTGTSLFGATQPQTQPSSGLFGSTQQPSTTPSTGFGGFGAATSTQPTISTGGFGAGGFGSTTTTSSLFGAPAATTGTTNTAGGFGAFNQPKPAGSLFGATTQPSTTSTFGGFGQPQQQQQQAKPTISTSFGGFGSTAQPQQQVQSTFGAAPSTSTGFSFGKPATTTTTFGQPAAGTTATATPSFGGGLFGSTQTQQPSTTTSTTGGGGLFGSTQPTSTTTGGLGTGFSFGGTAANTGSLFKPSTTTTAQTGTGGSSFTFGAQPTNQPSSTFSLSGMGGGTTLFNPSGTTSGATGLGGTGSLFQQPTASLFQPQGQQQQQQAPLMVSLDSNAYGNVQLLQPTGVKQTVLPPKDLAAVTKATTAQTKPSFTPKISIKIKPPGTKPKEITKQEPEVVSVEKFRQKRSVKKLEIQPSFAKPESLPASRVSTAPNTILKSTSAPKEFKSSIMVAETPVVKKVSFEPQSSFHIGTESFAVPTPKKLLDFTKTKHEESFDESIILEEPSIIIPQESPEKIADLEDGEYYMIPSVKKLSKKNPGELRRVENFIVGRKGYGEVSWSEPVDLSVFDSIETIPGNIVQISSKQCVVYPDEDILHHPMGQGLNKKAVVTLFNCWPLDKHTKQPIKDENSRAVQNQLNRMKSLKDTSFISFDTKTGTWKFSVEHFSRYGLLDDDDDEEETDENKNENEIIIDNHDESVMVKEIRTGSAAPLASNAGRYRLGKFEAFMKAKERSVTLPGNHPNAKPLHTVFDIGGSLVQLYDKEGAILTREKLSESSFDSKVTSSARTIFDALFGPFEESRREKMDEWFRSELITQVQSMQVQNDGNVYYRVFFYVLSKQLKKAVECCLNNQLFQLAAVVAQSDKLDDFSKSLLTSEAVKAQTSRGSNEWYLNLLLLLSGDTDGLFSRAEKVFGNWVLVAAACFYFVLDEGSLLEDLVLYLDDHFKSNNVEVDDICYRCLKAFIGDITFSEIFISSDTGRIDPVDLYDLYVQYKPELDLNLFKKLTFDVFASKNGKDCLFHLFELLKVSAEEPSIREFIKQVIVHGFRNSNTFKVENVSTEGIDESLSVDALSLLQSFDASITKAFEVDENLDCMWKSCVFYARSNNNRQAKDLLHYHVLPALFLDGEFDVSKYLLVNLLADNEKVDNVFHQFYRLKDVKDRSLEDLQLFMRVFLHEVSMSKSHNTKPLYLASINEIGRVALKWMTYSHVEKSKLNNFIHHLGIKIVS